ncbi:RHS repeat-associated core domain-containing protein [Gilliamella apicola]|uniref:RHS repeat-associated core domain-containing protein n=1 Tax=unclassified Gilliamella TaxID=2685620 RepID=UPI0009BDC98C
MSAISTPICTAVGKNLPIQQNLRYQGQYLDSETSLHYNTFRYDNPDIGRFTQLGLIGLLGSFNLYQYAPIKS